MKRMKQINGYVDPPCAFITREEDVPGWAKAHLKSSTTTWRQKLVDDGFSLVLIELPLLSTDGHSSAIVIDDEKHGEATLLLRLPDGLIRTETSWDGWSNPSNKRLEAACLFTGACGAGMMHFDSWRMPRRGERCSARQSGARCTRWM